MDQCFVIQPFDGGIFDKRYEDVIEPAIRAANLVPYRVDRDPGATIPIEQIENNIRISRVCVAEISLDNPNVWFELGYAMALNKGVVLVADRKTRARFPFDIQHRTVVHYEADSPSDFVRLSEQVTKRLVTMLETQATVQSVISVPRESGLEGLSAHEEAALVLVAADVLDEDETMALYSLRNGMSAAGFTDVATSAAVRGLVYKGLLLKRLLPSSDPDSSERYTAFSLTALGEKWFLDNQNKFVLRKSLPTVKRDGDIPF